MSWTTRYPWLDFPQQVVQTARHRDALERYQKQRLRRLLVHARDQVPYYRENGGPPEADQLAQWPVLSKDDLRNRAHDFLAPGCSPHKLLAHHSSGTTGNPVKVYRSWHEERALGLLRMRALHHWGVRWHHQRVQVRPGHFNWSRNWALDLLNRLGMYRLRAVSCFDSPAQIYQSLLRLRPDYLGGYPQVLETLCL